MLRRAQGKELDVPQDKEYLTQEVDNILNESNRMLTVIADGQTVPLTPQRICEINKIVLNGLVLDDGVIPGEIRTYSVGVMHYRGAPAEDCPFLFERLCEWLNGPDFHSHAGLSAVHMAILKAIIAHLYVEWIHGFGDGNGRTGRLLEVQILMQSGIPSPACHLLSNHYNQTRREYLRQLRAASESGGDILPFMTYALNGLLDELRGQIAYVRKLHMETTWVNFVHDIFRNQRSKAAHRQKALLLDLAEKGEAVPVSELDELSSRLSKEYAGMHPRTPARDIEALIAQDLAVRDGKKVKANLELISHFLPIKAKP